MSQKLEEENPAEETGEEKQVKRRGCGWASLGATVMGRETVFYQCGLVAMVSGSAGVGHILRHEG